MSCTCGLVGFALRSTDSNAANSETDAFKKKKKKDIPDPD